MKNNIYLGYLKRKVAANELANKFEK